MSRQSLSACFFLFAAVAVRPIVLLADDTPDSWLRGSGKDLEIRLSGEVIEADGQPASDAQVNCRLNGDKRSPSLEPTMDGHRFEVWIPVNALNVYSLSLGARSNSNGHVAFRNLSGENLRQAAIDHIKLTLQEPTRHVKVVVTDTEKPVAGARVKAELGFGADTFSKTDSEGIADIALLPDQTLSHLMAWTDDFRIGGFSFHRKPTRDPNAGEYVVELSKCRDHKFRFVEENVAPVPGVEFIIQIGTAEPNFNFLGTNENSRMTTNDAGEVLYCWFPDWEKHHFYPDLLSTGWFTDGEPQTDGDTTTFRLKRRKDRKQASGKITSNATRVGGFSVSLWSFQGEQKNHSDVVRAFTDADGRFTVDVLPDVRYCAYALDEKWVSDIIDLVPYVAASEQGNPLELTVSAGQDVEIIATIGSEKKPYANLPVYVQREHGYTWQENGKTRHGTSGPRWYVTTDSSGRTAARSLPGKLKLSVFSPEWRTEKDITVSADEVARVELHRENEQKHLILGHILLADGVNADIGAASVEVTAVDGKYQDQQSLKASHHGTFSFETFAGRTCIFCATKDGQAVGWAVVTDPTSPVEVKLRKSLDYEGQLLGDEDRPWANREVIASAFMAPDKDDSRRINPQIHVLRVSTKTDEHGNYTLHGLPSGLQISFHAPKADDSREWEYLATVVLDPNEARPRKVSRLVDKKPTQEIQLAQRYQKTLLDCAACGYRPILILANGGDAIGEFVNENFTNHERNRDVYDFMQVTVLQGDKPIDAADAIFLNEHGWQLPEKGHVLAVVLDSSGTEVGRLELNARDRAAPVAVAEFIHRHAPGQHDAEEEWKKAFAEAKRSNRRVWARISQRYCGPCFHLARWLDAERELLAKDYVVLKIDDYRDLHGADVAKKLTGGKQHGVPFFVIFDQDEKPLADSVAGPLGNVGFPSGVEGKRHLRKMLSASRQSLRDSEIDQLVEAVGN